jgi:hypothetical protein
MIDVSARRSQYEVVERRGSEFMTIEMSERGRADALMQASGGVVEGRWHAQGVQQLLMAQLKGLDLQYTRTWEHW